MGSVCQTLRLHERPLGESTLGHGGCVVQGTFSYNAGRRSAIFAHWRSSDCQTGREDNIGLLVKAFACPKLPTVYQHSSKNRWCLYGTQGCTHQTPPKKSHESSDLSFCYESECLLSRE